MIELIPIHRLVVTISVIYATIVAAIVWVCILISPNMSLSTAVGIAFGGANALNLFFLGFLHVAWKIIWKKFPQLNRILFPDLNGRWDMTIHWTTKDPENPQLDFKGKKIATALIRQSFIKLSIEVHSEDSNSETLIAQPKKDPESGTPLLYYVYRVVPKHLSSGADTPYQGAAVLRLSDISEKLQLSGNYFTDRGTKGHFFLEKMLAPSR